MVEAPTDSLFGWDIPESLSVPSRRTVGKAKYKRDRPHSYRRDGPINRNPKRLIRNSKLGRPPRHNPRRLARGHQTLGGVGRRSIDTQRRCGRFARRAGGR